ncbi:ABC transporter permease subunit [Dactylosporangium sp. AC04546]|uniref:ABC transporter permease subunit n=1 Tax=Dactylosporangium sp. AC04546 TaxID=2862460 RepID=UPI001EDF411E|nr:ABC transporter permease subunit [Dactylosporangium sp. AC04546]WVK85127.1 ABC transporter permease subunit [Dactylosporangium sp. AC04546]
MTSLLSAEWTRLFSRRVTIVALVLIGLLLAVLTFGFTLTRSTPTPDEIRLADERAASAAEIYDRNVEQCERVQSGLDNPQSGQTFPRGCDYGPRPTRDSMLDYGFSFHRQWPELYYTAAIVLAVAGFVLGASFVGVEWSSGGMLNLLLWAPRRATVLGAKLVAVCTGVTLISIASLMVWTLAFLAVAAGNGSVSSLGGGDVVSMLLTGARVILLAVAGTALGFAIASMGRHTSAALGVGIAYLVVYELGTLILFGLIGTDYSEKYRLSSYVSAWLTKSYTFEADVAACAGRGCVPAAGFSGSWQQGGLVIAVVVAVVLAGAFATMHRRDAPR